ncbi:hypothetical protein [Cohnella yongneupensis]|uniref:Uncharacterized protein n=1 Tax=Cohnella yongneupensis TaxID=425006 RepID=A0ABW0QXS2_9BACL
MKLSWTKILVTLSSIGRTPLSSPVSGSLDLVGVTNIRSGFLLGNQLKSGNVSLYLPDGAYT